MDPRPIVVGAAPGTEPVLAEQAIFTSIRSPSGRGYRIIAASPGISPDDKREIVQRAPSHQSICDASPHGCGLASFTMQSGRRCLFLAQNAGVEHSARGDYRVHTHVLIFEPAGYRRLHCDPLAILSAARAALAGDWLNDQPPATLTHLTLDVHAPAKDSHTAMRSPATDDVDGLLAVLSHVLSGRRVLLQGPSDLLRLLAWIWSGLPAAVRDALSLSCGLRCSPGRNFPLILTGDSGSERRRSGIGADFAVVEWPAATRPEATEFDPWLSFVRRRWAAGQLVELDHISAELTAASTVTDLTRVARLCDDLAQLADADLACVDELTARHAGGQWREGAGARLYTEFCRAAVIRRQQLQPPEEEAGESRQDACARTT